MAKDQNLRIEQRIGMRLSQQQLRFVKLLEFNAPELDEAVERELEDNPALDVKEEVPEEDTPLSALHSGQRFRRPACLYTRRHLRIALRSSL